MPATGFDDGVRVKLKMNGNNRRAKRFPFPLEWVCKMSFAWHRRHHPHHPRHRTTPVTTKLILLQIITLPTTWDPFQRWPKHEIHLLPRLQLEVLVDDNEDDDDEENDGDDQQQEEKEEVSSSDDDNEMPTASNSHRRIVYTSPTLSQSVQQDRAKKLKKYWFSMETKEIWHL